MKFLVIAALLCLLLLLLYSRLYPYIKFFKKILGAAKSMTDAPPNPTSAFRGTGADSKLVRCVGCGTWIPAERAIGVNSGRSIYCSQECLEKASNGKARKIAS